MPTYQEHIEQIRNARKMRDDAKDDLYASRMKRILSEKEQRRRNDDDPQFSINSDTTNIPNTNTNDDTNVKEQVYRRTQDQLNSLVADLFRDRTPQSLIEEWNDDIPVMLLPVRIETKFKIEPPLNQLWVRIYPDEIAIVTHEKTLSTYEEKLGKIYWTDLFNAGNDEIKKKEAWRKIADEISANRAAWVAKQTRPSNWDIRSSLSSPDGLSHPVFDVLKPNGWTEAPHSRIMPDRFVLLGFDENDRVILTHPGNQVKDLLITGPAPVDNGNKPSITRDDTTHRVEFGEDFAWVKDFQKAIDEGLGMKIDLSGNTMNGFAKLMALGLKSSADEADGKQLVEDLVDNHHYSRKGFAIVRQGSPTNNTEEEDSAFNSKDPMHELSYFVETGKPLFEPSDNRFKTSDAQRLAEYLGIEYSPLQYIANADLKDHAQAIAMNAAISAGTLDYFLDRMLNGVFSDAASQQIRDHFVNYVTGRGALPAIRVGKQPYGIMVTSSLPMWKYNIQRPGITGVLGGNDILTPMLDIIRYFRAQWQQLKPGLAAIGKGNDAGGSLVKILGLHPTSIEYFQRVAFSRDDVENKGLLMNDKYFRDVMDVMFQSSVVRAILKDLGYKEKEADGKLKPLPLLLQLFYQRYHTRLDNLNLIDGLPLSEKDQIKPFNAAGTQNYIQWLISNASDHTKLEALDFGGVDEPNSLLFLMLHFALLMETGKSISRYLGMHDIAATELIKPRKMMNMSSAPSVSPWEIFKTPVNLLVEDEPAATPLFTYIHSDRFKRPEFSGIVSNLHEQLAGLEVLKDMSTAALERVLAEHIDTLSYRLDSWEHSLFERRLTTKRNIPGNERTRKKGIYIGAYGYLENVRPTSKRERISEDVLPEKLRERTGNLYRDPGNGGYVHAPSLNHATAAAILRNGYLSYSSPAEKELLSVNLSSERVRRAMYLIEGVRNGQTLEVLLGYQFERGLHDFTTRPGSPVILNHLIPFFREKYPVKKTKIPQQGNVTGPEEVIDDFHVVNGMSVIKTAANFPEGLPGLPTLDATQISSIRIVKENIENTLDAFHDVLVSESAFQLALGNFDRAAAVVQAISDSHILPEIEVINTPRGSDLSFTNRLIVHFSASAMATPWNTIGMTPRADTEPAMNAWVGNLMGDPQKIFCKVTMVDNEGNAINDGSGIVQDVLSMAELRVQPLDIIFMINKEHESGFSELEMRIRHVFITKKSLDDAAITKITFSEKSIGSPAPGTRSFGEVLPLCFHIRQLITSSRVATARDYQSQSKKVTTPVADPDNINIADLLTRVNAVFNHISGLIPSLTAAVNDVKAQKTLVSMNALRTELISLADSGIGDAFPQSSTSISDLLLEALVAQGESVIKRIEVFSGAFNKKMLQVNDPKTTASQKLEILTELIRSMLGGDYVILPRFNLPNAADIGKCFQNRAELLEYSASIDIHLPVEEWLHGASLVRKKLRTFELIRIINDAVNDDAIKYLPIQIPYRKKDHWLAVEYPAGYKVYDDTVSIVQYNPHGFDANGTLCGLVVDDFTEFIPKNEETTGISFHYNQPNSCPPQAILLAVAPEDRQHWTWDALVSTVLDTFERAKLRAVEPDEVDKIPGITTLLPAIVSEFSTGANNVSLDYSFVIKEVHEQAKSLTAKL